MPTGGGTRQPLDALGERPRLARLRRTADFKLKLAMPRAIPARTRFLSCEPLLEAIEPDLSGIDWVICDGESGGGAREMDPAWACSLRNQCAGAGAAFFMKQMSRRTPIPDSLMVRQFPRPVPAYV